MRNRLIFFLLLCASASAAQPSVTGSTLVPLREGNNSWIASLNTIFGAIDVDLTSGVTGVLPVANGGTGLSTLTANRIPFGNGTSALQSSADLTYNGSRLAVGSSTDVASGSDLNGYTTSTLGSPVLTSGFQQFRLFGTPSTATNSITYNPIFIGNGFSNDGTPTGGIFQALVVQNTVASPTRLASHAGIVASLTNNSENNSGTLYGIRATLRDNTTSSSLNNRTAMSFDCDKAGDAVDYHTGRGVQGRVRDLSATGRWSAAFGADVQIQEALTGRGVSASVSNSRGTGNTQYGADMSLSTTGSGVTTTNAYGLNVSITTASSGAITNAYVLRNAAATTGITNAYNIYNSTAWRNYLNGNLAIGVDDTGAKLFVRGAGNTSGTNTAVLENSSGTDILTVRDDGMSAFGTTPSSTIKLIVRGTTSDATAEGFEVQSSSGTSTFSVDNSGSVSVGNAAYQEKLTVNGKVRSDGLVLNSQTDVTTAGHLIYNNASTNSGYFTIGDDSRAMAFVPVLIQRQVIDYGVDWTTGRKGAFWTVPARFDGWKIAKVYIGVSSIGSGAGDDELTVEIGGVGDGVQVITAGTHTLVMDDVINTDDIITFNVTAISATPAKGLEVSLELSKQ